MTKTTGAHGVDGLEVVGGRRAPADSATASDAGLTPPTRPRLRGAGPSCPPRRPGRPGPPPPPAGTASPSDEPHAEPGREDRQRPGRTRRRGRAEGDGPSGRRPGTPRGTDSVPQDQHRQPDPASRGPGPPQGDGPEGGDGAAQRDTEHGDPRATFVSISCRGGRGDVSRVSPVEIASTTTPTTAEPMAHATDPHRGRSRAAGRRARCLARTRARGRARDRQQQEHEQAGEDPVDQERTARTAGPRPPHPRRSVPKSSAAAAPAISTASTWRSSRLPTAVHTTKQRAAQEHEVESACSSSGSSRISRAKAAPARPSADREDRGVDVREPLRIDPESSDP